MKKKYEKSNKKINNLQSMINTISNKVLKKNRKISKKRVVYIVCRERKTESESEKIELGMCATKIHFLLVFKTTANNKKINTGGK